MIEIAIDGTAASGKGTLAKNLSEFYGCLIALTWTYYAQFFICH